MICLYVHGLYRQLSISEPDFDMSTFIFYGESLGLIMPIVLSYALLEIVDNIMPLHDIDIRASRQDVFAFSILF